VRARLPSDSAQAFRQLDIPRRVSESERRLLSWLAASVGHELVAQVTDAVVVGECTCGCSSVRLSTRAALLPAQTVTRLSGTGRDDYLAVSSTSAGGDDDVVLHVLEGRLHELEIFAGDGVAVDPATVSALTPTTVG
jgi:hypothetical protein